jgi:hypothetical protein
MSYNVMIGYDIYDRFTMEHFLLCQSMILTTSFFCSRQYLPITFLILIVIMREIFFCQNLTFIRLTKAICVLCPLR